MEGLRLHPLEVVVLLIPTQNWEGFLGQGELRLSVHDPVVWSALSDLNGLKEN